VVLRGAQSDGDGVGPYRSAGNASGNGQSHDALSHASHRHSHGGGGMVDMDRLGRSGSLKPG